MAPENAVPKESCHLEESLKNVHKCLPNNSEFLGAFDVARKFGTKWLVAIQRADSSENLW